MDQTIILTAKKIIPQWNTLHPHSFVVERMTGITNQTYKISHPQTHDAVIYRKFGDASDSKNLLKDVFLDRKSEKFVYEHISKQKLGPRIFGYLNNVRLQSFIPSKVLKTEQMLALPYSYNVAYALNKFHSMKPPQQIQKKSLFTRIFFHNPSVILQKCFKKLNADIFAKEEQQIVQQLKEWVTIEEVKFLQQITKPLQQQKLVFSHNDLLANNVLLRESDEKVIFIDYEYSCFNYPIFDIANYFNQIQYDYDYPQQPFFRVIPCTEQKQKQKDNFIRYYCLGTGTSYLEYKKLVLEGFQLNQEQIIQYKKLKNHLIIGEMLSNLMWGWWAIIVCKNPQINFDYLQFGKKRMDDYLSSKKIIHQSSKQDNVKQ